MLGIIATIVAAKKGRTTFALITGIWTVGAFILYYLNIISILFLPGWLFLIIALMMDKVPELEDIVYYCPECSFVSSCRRNSPENNCPKCGHEVKKTDITQKAWLKMSLEENDKYKKSWGIQPTPVSVSDSKKYVCSACGAFCSGWYQKCPSCGAIGKMELAHMAIPKEANLSASPGSANEEQPDGKHTSLTNTSVNEAADTGVDKILFCRKCGARLGEGSMFCHKCGTKII